MKTKMCEFPLAQALCEGTTRCTNCGKCGPKPKQAKSNNEPQKTYHLNIDWGKFSEDLSVVNQAVIVSSHLQAQGASQEEARKEASRWLNKEMDSLYRTKRGPGYRDCLNALSALNCGARSLWPGFFTDVVMLPAGEQKSGVVGFVRGGMINLVNFDPGTLAHEFFHLCEHRGLTITGEKMEGIDCTSAARAFESEFTKSWHPQDDELMQDCKMYDLLRKFRK